MSAFLSVNPSSFQNLLQLWVCRRERRYVRHRAQENLRLDDSRIQKGQSILTVVGQGLKTNTSAIGLEIDVSSHVLIEAFWQLRNAFKKYPHLSYFRVHVPKTRKPLHSGGSVGVLHLAKDLLKKLSNSCLIHWNTSRATKSRGTAGLVARVNGSPSQSGNMRSS